MKITVQHQNFKKAINLVERVVSRNVSLPILNNILLKTENGRLKIVATNLEIGITCTIGSKVEIVGEIAVPGRVLSNLVNTTPEGTLTLSKKNNTLHVVSETYRTNILGSDAKDFPIIPKIKTNPIASIPSQILRSILASTTDSIATSESRPELAGLAVSFSDKNITFAATDSFRLVEKKIENQNTNQHSVIIPRNTVMELARLTSDTDSSFDVRINDNQISFSNEDMEIVSRLVEGTYPDYTKVIPDKVVTRVLVKKQDLEKNVRLAGLFSSNISDVNIKCEDSYLTISAKNTERGDVQAKTEAIIKNEPFELSLNFNYLLDGLKIIPTEKAVIEFTGQGSPLLIKPDNETKLVYLIMPLRGQ